MSIGDFYIDTEQAHISGALLHIATQKQNMSSAPATIS
jgi:hypothetical protein